MFEFQPPGVHLLTENETYYSLGTQAALENYEALRAHYGYNKTMSAYHYYTTLVKLLAQPPASSYKNSNPAAAFVSAGVLFIQKACGAFYPCTMR